MASQAPIISSAPTTHKRALTQMDQCVAWLEQAQAIINTVSNDEMDTLDPNSTMSLDGATSLIAVALNALAGINR